MGSHYIPVGKIKIDKDILDIVCPAAGYDSTPPPPEIYCPVNGFIPDPTIYHEDPVITEAPRPGDGQIRLIVTDSGSRHIQFKCTVSNAGKYVVTITGADDTVILTETKNNNAVFSTFVPLLEGYPTDSYTYYFVDIAPELETNDLTIFAATINATYDPNGGYIIAAFFNAPGLTSLEKMFLNMKRIKYTEFVSNHNNLTSLFEAWRAAEELERVVFPKEMNALITVENMLYGTTNLKDINLHETEMQFLENMNSFLQQSGLTKFIFPENIDSVLTIKSGFATSNIENVTLFNSAENLQYILNLFHNCYKLKGKIIYPEIPNLIDFEYVHYNNYEVEEIQFLGNYDNETIITLGRQMFANCKKIKIIKFPEKINMKNNYFNSIEGCENLEYLYLPKKWWSDTSYQSRTPYKQFFLGFLTNTKLKYISKVEETNLDVQFVYNIYFQLNTKVSSFDQPNIQPSNAAYFNALQGINPIEYVDLNFEKSTFSLFNIRQTKISIENIIFIINNRKARRNSIGFAQILFKNSMLENNTLFFNSTLNYNNLKITSGIIPPVGTQLQIRYLSWDFVCNIDSLQTSTFGFGTYAFDDDTKISFRGDETQESGSGIDFYKTYYIINATNTTFQISETKGGTPITILKDFMSNVRAVPELKVLSINNNIAVLNGGNPNGGNYITGNFFFDDPEIDIYKANSNGWYFVY